MRDGTWLERKWTRRQIEFVSYGKTICLKRWIDDLKALLGPKHSFPGDETDAYAIAATILNHIVSILYISQR